MGRKGNSWFPRSSIGLEMKIRVIPTILTDGVTVVKGEKFDNWRTVGTAEASARLYASRNVDELLLLDVTRRFRNSGIDTSQLAHFSNVLDIPFSVGGGISTLDDAKLCFRYGAEKIVLGTKAVTTPNLVSDIANVFGNQAVIVAVDFAFENSDRILLNSGKSQSEVNGLEFIEALESLGAGEILLQSVERDGTLSGMDFDRIKRVSKLTRLPIIASGGASTLADFEQAVLCGASAIAAGAIFQFTQITPAQVRMYLSEQGIQTRML